MSDILKGIGIGFILQALCLWIITLFINRGSSTIDFLLYSFENKSIILLLAMASVLNVAVFFYLVSNNKQLNIARGIQYFLIGVVGFLLAIKLS